MVSQSIILPSLSKQMLARLKKTERSVLPVKGMFSF